jgi:hypothetical protein
MFSRLSENEIEVLKSLAEKIEKISNDKKWQEKIALWKKINSLEKTRPLVMFPPECWDELISTETYLVKDPLFRYFEEQLRQNIYRYEFIHDDIVITNKLYVPYSTSITDWVKDRERPYSKIHGTSEKFHPCIMEISDLKKLKYPKLTIDFEKSNENYELSKKIFGDYLEVIMGEPLSSNTFNKVLGWGKSIIDVWCELRGLDRVFMDLIENPEFTKDALKFIMEGILGVLDEGIKNGIWALNNNGWMDGPCTPTGSNGLAYTDELPSNDFKNKIRLKDLWGYAMAQEFTSVSPDMLEEFVLPYQAKILSRFGLNSYGCCENGDNKWDVLKRKIPNLREVSVSAFSDLQVAIDNLQDDYVLSWKANPTEMLSVYSPENQRKKMTSVIEMSKDVHIVLGLREAWTVYGEPKRAISWVDETMKLAQKYE